MMVISRRLGEGIVIDGTIYITVVKVGKGRIRLGLTAPASVRIHRQEELFPKFEDTNGFEALGGSSASKPITLLPFPMKEPKEVAVAKKGERRTKPSLPALVEMDHGTGNSHRSRR